MTQDPYGQPPGTGYVVRGEVVPDDEANVTPPTAPMTHFQKVASALRGDRTDPIPVQVPSAQGASPESADPDGTWPGANQATTATSSSLDAQDAAQDATADAQDDADRDATRPEEVAAVRSPDAGNRDYWDDADRTGPEEAGPEEAGPEETLGEPAGAAGASAAGAGGAAGAGAAGAGAAEAGTATLDPATTQPDLYGAAAHTEVPEVGAAEPDVVGKHAGAAAREGLRPGEADDGLGDFSDLTYGSLLPDAAEFKARWQQVQFRFVDDPQGSVTEAADVIAQVTAKLEAAIAERQRAIAERQRALRGRWSEGKSADTESLRETLLMYRAFLNQLTWPKDG
jgi:hypothetical protein